MFNLFSYFLLLEIMLQLIFYTYPLCESEPSGWTLGCGMAGLRPRELEALLGMAEQFFKVVVPVYTLIAMCKSSHTWHSQQHLVISDFKISAKLMG